MPPAPPRVAENINIGRPEGKTFVDISVSFPAKCIVFCSSLLGNYVRNPLYFSGIKHCRKRNRLRKYCRGSGSCNSMERFIPPVICRNPQSLYPRCVKFKLTGTLLYCHLKHKLFCFLSCFLSIHLYPFLVLRYRVGDIP